MEFGGEPASSC